MPPMKLVPPHQHSCHTKRHHTVAVCRMVPPGTELSFIKYVPFLVRHYGCATFNNFSSQY